MASRRPEDDVSAQSDAPAGVPMDDEYVSRTGQKQAPVPVQSDNDPTGDNNPVDDPDSDKALEADEAAAIDKSNIIKERTRGNTTGNMTEPGDEEGLPGASDGTSRLATEGVEDPAVKDI
ncbi:hypothetical protein B0A50_04648 [Salinomyces thailandicus]|uniref:Histone chaperone domain-containing protein n=1 Tax=Salinomyces thailandicus TaxID=706561 RepID=A0A4U0TUZ0_9PEZI|nr:hypothetical protein B0A50_04648 [Salinomyces thailandica]